jgi:hypothetical protein
MAKFSKDSNALPMHLGGTHTILGGGDEEYGGLAKLLRGQRQRYVLGWAESYVRDRFIPSLRPVA